MKDDERSGQPTSQTDDNIASVDKMVKENQNVMSQLIADTLSIPKTVVLQILRGDLKKQQCPGAFGSKNLTVSDSKTSCQICLPRLLPVPEDEVAAEGCKI